MITNFSNRTRKDDIRLICIILAIFLFGLWLSSPPGNKFAQVCFYNNNIQFLVAKMTKDKNEINEWLFHRNNAIYLARMERKNASLKEMDLAIKTAPHYLTDSQISSLYADRAQLRLFFNDYKGSLDDFLKVKDPGILERFKIALLFKEVGNNKEALTYCNSVINSDPSAYIGYACIADVYAGVGRYETSVRVYDLLIDRAKNRAKYYADRALYKRKCGDADGYAADMAKAKELSPMVDVESSVIQDTIKPKHLTMSIM